MRTLETDRAIGRSPDAGESWPAASWYAVQSKPHQESLAATTLAKCDIEVFLPRIRVEQSICGTPRLITKPLFAGYLFARFCPILLFDVVRYAQGVLRVLGTQRLPIPLEAEIIAALRARVASDGFVHLTPKAFSAGDKVTIEQGPFAGWVGEVEREWDDGKRVMILLDAIEKARMLVEKRQLALMATAR